MNQVSLNLKKAYNTELLKITCKDIDCYEVADKKYHAKNSKSPKTKQ